MKLDRPAIALLGVSTLTSIAFVVFGAISLMGSLAKNDNQPSSERLNFTLGPGEVRRVTAYVVGGDTMRYVSDIGGSKIHYRLRLDDGHTGSILTEKDISATEQGNLRPLHGSLYEWSWNNRSKRPIRVGLLVEGNFDLLRRPTASPIVQGFEQ